MNTDMSVVLCMIATDRGGLTAEMVSGLLYFRDLNPTASPEGLAKIIDSQIMDHTIESGLDAEDYDMFKIRKVLDYLELLWKDHKYRNIESPFWEEVYNSYYFESGYCDWDDETNRAYMNIGWTMISPHDERNPQ